MLIKRDELPSKGWKTDLPETFEMLPFSGKHARNVSEAIEKESMMPLMEALIECLPDIDAMQISIQDAYFLLLIQRLKDSDVSPLAFEWQCAKPLYQYPDGYYIELQDRPSIGVNPCSNWTHTILDKSSLSTVYLNEHSDRFDIPRLKNFEEANQSRFDWIAAHLNSDHRAAINELEHQEDLVLFHEIVEWVKKSQHGISSNVICTCSSCNRETQMVWNFTAQAFA